MASERETSCRLAPPTLPGLTGLARRRSRPSAYGRTLHPQPDPHPIGFMSKTRRSGYPRCDFCSERPVLYKASWMAKYDTVIAGQTIQMSRIWAHGAQGERGHSFISFQRSLRYVAATGKHMGECMPMQPLFGLIVRSHTQYGTLLGSLASLLLCGIF